MRSRGAGGRCLNDRNRAAAPRSSKWDLGWPTSGGFCKVSPLRQQSTARHAPIAHTEQPPTPAHLALLFGPVTDRNRLCLSSQYRTCPVFRARSNRKQAKRNVTKSKHRTIPFVPMESDEQLGRLQLFCGFGYQFPIACVERQTGRVVWCTDVWAVRRGFCSGSPNIHYVEVVASRDSLFVFGAEVCGMYVESFDKTSGASICRF